MIIATYYTYDITKLSSTVCNIFVLQGHLRDLKTQQQQEKERFDTKNVNSRLSDNKRLYQGSKTVSYAEF